MLGSLALSTTVVGVASLVLTLLLIGASVLAAIIVLGRSKGMKDNVDIIATTNDELRAANVDLRAQMDRNKLEYERQRQRDKADFELKLLQQDTDCKRAISELRGQIQVLRGDLIKALSKELVDAIKEHLK